jgi:Uma2 family endonuclease
MSTPANVFATAEVVYPECDGKPMGENTLQFDYIVLIKEGHEVLYMDRADVFVAGDLFWYPVQGNNAIVTAPDTMIVFSRPKGHRGSYRQWEEGGIAPQVVWEVVSPTTTVPQRQELFGFYQRHRVEEYYEYDPQRGTLSGWLRQRRRLVAIADIQGWVSPRTGVRMELVGTELRLTYPDGQPFRSLSEHNRLREEAVRQAAREKRRAEREKRRANREKDRADEEKQRADEEKQRADELAARLRELGIDPDA